MGSDSTYGPAEVAEDLVTIHNNWYLLSLVLHGRSGTPDDAALLARNLASACTRLLDIVEEWNAMRKDHNVV